jgi:hypothetical protein
MQASNYSQYGEHMMEVSNPYVLKVLLLPSLRVFSIPKDIMYSSTAEVFSPIYSQFSQIMPSSGVTLEQK